MAFEKDTLNIPNVIQQNIVKIKSVDNYNNVLYFNALAIDQDGTFITSYKMFCCSKNLEIYFDNDNEVFYDYHIKYIDKQEDIIIFKLAVNISTPLTFSKNIANNQISYFLTTHKNGPPLLFSGRIQKVRNIEKNEDYYFKSDYYITSKIGILLDSNFNIICLINLFHKNQNLEDLIIMPLITYNRPLQYPPDQAKYYTKIAFLKTFSLITESNYGISFSIGFSPHNILNFDDFQRSSIFLNLIYIKELIENFDSDKKTFNREKCNYIQVSAGYSHSSTSGFFFNKLNIKMFGSIGLAHLSIPSSVDIYSNNYIKRHNLIFGLISVGGGFDYSLNNNLSIGLNGEVSLFLKKLNPQNGGLVFLNIALTSYF